MQSATSRDSVQVSKALAEVTENQDMSMEDFAVASHYFDILTRSLKDVPLEQTEDVDTLVKVGLLFLLFSDFFLKGGNRELLQRQI